jgi:hypothetical protein
MEKEKTMTGSKKADVFDVSSLFEQELQARNEDLRRQAAIAMLPKLRPSPKVSMAEFLDTLQQHKDVWKTVLEMTAVDFSSVLLGGGRTERPSKSAPSRRTRISDAQKNSLKGAIVSVLSKQRDGLNRNEIAGQISDDVLSTMSIKRAELADKLRQPLHELVDENKIHPVGEKRLLKYHAGPKK